MTKKQRELAEKAKEKLTEELRNNDTESAHVNADEILLELLLQLGFEDVVDLYNQIDKWYA